MGLMNRSRLVEWLRGRRPDTIQEGDLGTGRIPRWILDEHLRDESRMGGNARWDVLESVFLLVGAVILTCVVTFGWGPF